MRFWKCILTLGTLFFMTGCNPFGSGSFINIIGEIENRQSTTEINAGGKTQLTVPASGIAADAHSVSFSVGIAFNQNTFVTGNGHTVSISISSAKDQ